MQEITIKNKVYNLPTSWDEMTFGQFLKLTNYVQSIQTDDYDSYPDDLFHSNILALLLDIPKDTFLSLSLVDANIFTTSIQFINTKFNDVPYSKNIEYKNMVIKIRNFEEIKYGEYIDISAEAASNSETNLIKLISYISDVYLKKDIKKFRFKDKKMNLTPEVKMSIIASLPATQAKAITTFFLRGQEQLGANTASYLNKLAFRLAMKGLLQTVGLIIYGLWMHVMKILLSLGMLLTFRFDKFLRIWRTKLPRII